VAEPIRVDRAVYRRNALLGLLTDLLCLTILAGFVAFYRVNDVSFHHVDESTHVRVTQEMLQDGELWRPKVFGRYYYNKPPFKMWLTILPVKIFGPTNFAFRFWDGLCGIMSVIALYLFGRTLFHSRTIAFVAALTLITSKAYVFHHGLRTSTQDSMVNFLNLLSMFIGWRLIALLRRESSASKAGRRKVLLTALGGGVCVGCAALTKNVAGYLPLVMIALFAVFSGELSNLWKRGKLPIFIVVFLGILFPALYLIPHLLRSQGIWMVMFGDEVLERVTVGYHNRGNYLFYLRSLLKGTGAPPVLLIPGILLALGYWFFRRDKKFLFVLIWALFPLILFSMIPSRLTWYMVPAFPGLSLLAGLAFEVALKQFTRLGIGWWRGGRRQLIPAVLFGGYLLIAGLGILKHTAIVCAAVLDRDYRLDLDKISEEIYFSKEFSDYNFVIFRDPALARNERIYRDRIVKREFVADFAVLEARIKDPKVAFVLADAADFKAIAQLRHIEEYKFLPPETIRETNAVFISYVSGLASLDKFKKTTDIGQNDEEAVLYGFGKTRDVSQIRVRRVISPEAALLIDSDLAQEQQPTLLRLSAAVTDAKRQSTLDLKIAVNGVPAGSVKVSGENYRTYELPIAPGSFRAGKSTVSIALDIPEYTDPNQFLSGPVGINWVSIEVLTGR